MKELKSVFFLFLLTITGCQNELYENKLYETAIEQKRPFKTKTVSLNQIPEVNAIINQKFGDIKSGKFKTNKSASGTSNDAVFETRSILEVVDTLANKNYSIRFSFSDTPENITYNLIVNILPNNTQNVFVEKYTCNPENFMVYKNNMYSFKFFKGRVDLYKASAFFSKKSFSGKQTSDPCMQLTYPNGDPVPAASSFIDGSGANTSYPSGGGSGNPYINNGYTYGPSTWTYYPPDDSGDSSDSGDSGSGCCSCGNCGTHWYPPYKKNLHTQKMSPCEDVRPAGFITLNAEPESLRMLREKLLITVEQWQWLHGKDHIANALLSYVMDNPTVANAKRNAFEIIKFGTEMNIQIKLFPLQMLRQMELNPDLIFDVYASYFSPFNIDKSAITNATPEGAKFIEIYGALEKSPEFKNLFIKVFEDSNKFNVKFEIADHVYEDNNPTKKEVHAITIQNPTTKNLTIKISKQILTTGTDIIKGQTNIENAKTILHECIHAYLFVKRTNPTVGMNIEGIINTMYPTYNEQHDFMYNKMIPTMQIVLSQIRDQETTAEKRTEVEQRIIHPNFYTNLSNTVSWNWSNYYKCLIFKGLEEVSCFKEDFPADSDASHLLGQYINYGHDDLQP